MITVKRMTFSLHELSAGAMICPYLSMLVRLKIMLQLTLAAQCIHATRWAHGDISCANIWLNFFDEKGTMLNDMRSLRDVETRLGDFELWRWFGQRALGGTPPYSAPELDPNNVPRGKKPYAASAERDIWALGVVFLFICRATKIPSSFVNLHDLDSADPDRSTRAREDLQVCVECALKGAENVKSIKLHDIISKMLSIDPVKRPEAMVLVAHFEKLGNQMGKTNRLPLKEQLARATSDDTGKTFPRSCPL